MRFERLVRAHAMPPAACVLAALLLPVSARGGDPLAVVAQRWSSSGVQYGETDSLAAGELSDGRTYVFATAKKADRVDVFDAETGRYVRSIGKTGTDAGQFAYPNGILFVPAATGGSKGDAPTQACLLVVERDNKRVQALCPETGASLGVFGQTHLEKPYGLALAHQDRKTLLYVTDESAKPDARVHVFELTFDGRTPQAKFVRNFGDTSGAGLIGEPESVVVDERLGRVLLCDEDSESKRVLVYTLDGHFAGKAFAEGLIDGDPEGIALLDAPGCGHVLVTDQRKKLTVWHVFERDSLKHVGSFTGRPTIANTDGICVYPHAFAGFRAGALFAVNDDHDIRAYDLADVLDAIRQ